MANLFLKHKLVILYGMALSAVLLLLKWLEFRFVIMNHSFQVYIGGIALIFTSLGVWLTLKLAKTKTKTLIIEKEVFITKPVEDYVPDGNALTRAGITKREWEVLLLMAKGFSNQEIAAQLFVSLNTVKTHCSNLFEKLDVKRRTQAIEKGKKLGLLA